MIHFDDQLSDFSQYLKTGEMLASTRRALPRGNPPTVSMFHGFSRRLCVGLSVWRFFAARHASCAVLSVFLRMACPKPPVFRCRGVSGKEGRATGVDRACVYHAADVYHRTFALSRLPLQNAAGAAQLQRSLLSQSPGWAARSQGVSLHAGP